MELNTMPRTFWCWGCMDSGMVERCHPSTDAVVGMDDCESCPPLVKGVFLKPNRWPWGAVEWKRTPEEIADDHARMPF